MLPRRSFVWLGLAALALGAFVLAYHGPGRAIVRGHVGDTGATMLVFALLGLVRPQARLWIRASLTLAIAFGVELGQLFWHARSTAGELLWGSTCDPWDLLAYVIGVGVAVAWEARGMADAKEPI